MEINLITTNMGKVKEFKSILEPTIKVNHTDYDYLELRSDDPEEIARLAAKHVAEHMNKTVVVDDSGMFIKALGDFPGTCSAYVHKRIGLKGILKLMEDKEDRTAHYRCAIGYCEPGKEPVSFLGEEKGTLAKEERGTYGFGHDPIFIPENKKNTYAELENYKDLKQFRRNGIKKLLDYLKDNSD